MSIDLILTLWADQNGNDRFKVQAPIGEELVLVDVTEQFELSVVADDQGRMGFAVFRKQAAPMQLSCLDGPVDV